VLFTAEVMLQQQQQQQQQQHEWQGSCPMEILMRSSYNISHMRDDAEGISDERKIDILQGGVYSPVVMVI